MRVSGGSGDLCDLLPAVHGRAVEGANKSSKVTVTTQPAEAASDLLQAGSDPADERAAVAPAAHRADEVSDEAVEILDAVGIRSVRYSAPVTPRRGRVRVSSSPSRRDAAAPGCVWSSPAASCRRRRLASVTSASS